MYALTALALLVVVACTQATPIAGGGLGGIGIGGIRGIGGIGGIGHGGLLIRGRRSILAGNILAPGLIGRVGAVGLVPINNPGLAAKALGLEGSGIEGQWIPDINEKLYDDGSYRPGGLRLLGGL